MSLTYRAMDEAEYARIVPANSPLVGAWADLSDACQANDVNPRVVLAWLRSENQFATDISAGLLAAHNAAGIKWVGQGLAINGQAGVNPPLAPANEGSAPYCVFANWHDFFVTLALNIKTILPDAWAAGDLASIASYYTTGDPHAGGGANKVTFFNEYEGGSVADGVYGEDLIAKARQYIGQANSDGTLDTLNQADYPNHPWSYWCESFAESIPRALGLQEVPRGTALDKGNACQSQGLFRAGPPQHGDWMIFSARFYAQGHICFFDAEKGKALGTLTDGTGIGYAPYGPNSPGYMGCLAIPGTVAPYRTVPVAVLPPSANAVPPNNPYNHGISDPAALIGIGGGFKTLWQSVPNPVPTFGFPMSNEQTAYVMEPNGERHERVVQFFERAIFCYNKDMPQPWDCTLALRSQTVVPR